MPEKTTTQQIIDILKKCPIHHSKDNNDVIMYSDLDYRVICYSTNNKRLFEIKTAFYPVVHHLGKTRETFNKTIKNTELSDLLQELQEHQCKEHVLK